MKKTILLLLAVALCLSSFACGNENAESTPPPAIENTTPPITDNQVPTETLPSTDESTSNEIEETLPPEPSFPVFVNPNKVTYDELDKIIVDQSNRHGMNAFCFDNSWIYGAWAGENYTGEVVKVRYDNSDWTVIDSDTQGNLASCQAVKSGYIYYDQKTADGTELVKVRSSGEDAKVIISNHEGSIQIVDNYIYYTTPETYTADYSAVTEDSCHLYRCDLNGEAVEAIIESPVYYFSVFEDYILYQDDKDGMTLHIYKMSSRVDMQINQHRSFWPIYDGNYIYYLTDSTSPENGQYKLWRLSLDGLTHEEVDLGCYLGGLLLRGDYIYYINMDDSRRIYRCLKDGSEIELVTQDSSVSAFQWVNECLAYMTRDDEGYISGIFLCDADGADKIEFCKSDDYWYLG